MRLALNVTSAPGREATYLSEVEVPLALGQEIGAVGLVSWHMADNKVYRLKFSRVGSFFSELSACITDVAGR